LKPGIFITTQAYNLQRRMGLGFLSALTGGGGKPSAKKSLIFTKRTIVNFDRGRHPHA
jgi:hypothetical protein